MLPLPPSCYHWLPGLALTCCLLLTPDAQAIPPELVEVTKTTKVIEAFRPTRQFDRHDPSNIIRYEDRFWVFYTRNVGDHKEVSVHLAFSTDGYAWKDAGEAIGRGAPGSWDESGAIAPYVVLHAGKFYLFYTGFREGNLATRELGCAIADRPSGPWKRWPANPILRRNPDPSAWDSGMLGDANVIFREGKWWLYLKSRRGKETNQDTRIGVAFADQITGPYRKHPGNPLFAGHAFSAWLHRDGVAALCGSISSKIKWSRDGLRFEDAGEFPNQSTGLFTPYETADQNHTHGFDWGLEVYEENGARGLRRFDCLKEQAEEVHPEGILRDLLALKEAVLRESPSNRPHRFVTFWDFDGTILAGDCTEGWATNGVPVYKGLPERCILAGLCELYRGPEGVRQFWSDYERMDQSPGTWLATPFLTQMFQGVKAAELEQFARRVFESELTNFLFASTMKILRGLSVAGIEAHVVTGSPQVLVRGAAGTVGIPPQNIHGVRVAEREGRLTGELIYPVTWAAGKAQRLQELLEQWKTDQPGCDVHVLGAFGNSYSSDGPFMAWAAQRRMPGTNRAVLLMINGGEAPEGYRGLFREVIQSRIEGARR